jgi:2-amino-4-hydroxy-6-hydroxymethyldihydropteridine diphosphokinase
VKQKNNRIRVFIGLGSNLGDRKGTIERALASLVGHEEIELVRRSSLLETKPWGVADQPRFINAVAELLTTLGPRALLDHLKKVEADLGRRHRDLRWGPREIDLDILFYGDLCLNEADLVIPHERILERPFVVQQILELDDEVVHPGFRVPLRHLAGRAPYEAKKL